VSAPTDARSSYSASLGFGAFSFVAVAAISLASGVVIARLYGIEALGAFALAQAPSLALVYISTAQEQAALVRELSVLPPRHPRVTGLFIAVLAFSFGLTLLLAPVALVIGDLVLSGPLDRPDLVAPAAVLVAAYVLVQNTSWNLDMVFAAFRAGRELFWIRLVQTLSFLLVAVVAEPLFTGVWGLVAATAGSLLIALAMRLSLARAFIRGRVSAREVRSGARALPGLIRWGVKVAPGTVVEGVSAQSGTWIIGLLNSTAALGAYTRAGALVARLFDLPMRVTEMLFPTLVERRASGDSEGFDRALIDTLRYMALALLWPAAVGAAASHAIMSLFGPGFSQAGNALAILLLFPVLVSITMALSTALWAVNRPGTVTLLQIGETSIYLAAAVALTSTLGITGTAIAAVGAHAARFVMTTAIMRRYLSVPVTQLWPLREILGLAAGSAVTFAAARLTAGTVAGVWGLMASLASGTAVYGGMLLILVRGNERDRGRLTALVTQARRARRLGRAPADARR
jgi:O-antigen/teichoic acid export membrane protein